jgi:endonuclease YncB( thermonuclease family)
MASAATVATPWLPVKRKGTNGLAAGDVNALAVDEAVASPYRSGEVMGMAKAAWVGVLLAVCVGLSAAALPGYPYPTVWGTVVNVIDGNRITVQIVGASTRGWIAGSTETVRYLGSYASPTEETICGAIATQVNYQMTFSRLVYLEFDEQMRDADGTLAAYVYLDGGGFSMVNAMLVALGITKATVEDPNTRYSSYFQALEATAVQYNAGCLGTQ